MNFGDQDLNVILFGAAELDSSFGFVGDDLLPIVKEVPWDMLYALASQLPLLGLEKLQITMLKRLEVRNAIGNDTLRGLQNTFEAVSEDSSANVLLINNKVPKMFCAGADLKVRLERFEVRSAVGKDMLRGLQNTFEAASEDSAANVLLISSKVPKMFYE